MPRRLWVAAALAALAASAARADTIITEGMEPWETCAECHNLDGISIMPKFPKLAGQRPAYIVKQVRDFRDKRRRNDGGQMAAIAGEIGDEDLAKAAAYFGGLPPPPPDASQAADTDDWRRGAGLYRDGNSAAGIVRCSSCHDATASQGAQGTQAPFLTAQHAAYLAKQLRDWRSGERGNDTTAIMPAIAAKLSDRDIAALAAFLASQSRIAPNSSQAQ
jgi:cytochrome c553